MLTKVNTNITAKKDGHLGFSGLNAWQPLGISASANEKNSCLCRWKKVRKQEPM